MLTVTRTRTYNVLHEWASTQPWACLVRDTNCISPTHDHDPMVNDPCAVEDCGERLVDREDCYAVVELPRLPGVGKGERWVCWRHVRPDKGPVRS